MANEQHDRGSDSQPWGANVSGDPVRHEPDSSEGSGVGGASFAGTPAGPRKEQENAEAETSGLKPPVGTSTRFSTGAADDDDPPQSPGAFPNDVTPPPVYDE